MAIGRALDSNNDLILRDGAFLTLDAAGEAIQAVRTRLLTYLGEWFLDNTVGTPWYEEVFVKPTNLANVESIIKTRILETDGIASLSEFTMDYDGGNSRRLTVNFTGHTTEGIEVDFEELINL